MAATQKKTLFNDPTLSDVKIKQISNDKTREYFGHKAILCAQSDFFMKAFTGGFKEASEAWMEIHDDSPEHFEFALKFMYTLDYDVKAIEVIVGKDQKTKRAQFDMGVNVIADKYGIDRLITPGVHDLRITLEGITKRPDYEYVVACYYSHSVKPGSTFGLQIVSTIFKSHPGFTASTEFTGLSQHYPVFASDVMASFVCFPCRVCKHITATKVTSTGIKPVKAYCSSCLSSCTIST